MRLGGKDVKLVPGTLASFLFDEREIIRQRFRHRYEVNPSYIANLEEHGMIFSGRHPEYPIMQILELPLKDHPYFIGSQFHPGANPTSRPLHPHPDVHGLGGGRHSPRPPRSRPAIKSAPCAGSRF